MNDIPVRVDGTSGESDEDPIARALGYPYPRHPGAVLFDPATGSHPAHVVDIGPEREHAVAGVDRPLPARAVAVEAGGQTIEIDDAVALIAAGSNGSTVPAATCATLAMATSGGRRPSVRTASLSPGAMAANSTLWRPTGTWSSSSPQIPHGCSMTARTGAMSGRI